MGVPNMLASQSRSGRPQVDSGEHNLQTHRQDWMDANLEVDL